MSQLLCLKHRSQTVDPRDCLCSPKWGNPYHHSEGL